MSSRSVETHEKLRHYERERKFLIDILSPELLSEAVHAAQIQQGYITLSENAETRIRSTTTREGAQYTLTTKSGNDVQQRQEDEVEITKDIFDQLSSRVSHRFVSKIRYSIPYGKFTIEIDMYRGEHEGLIIAEVEAESEAALQSFVPPAWFGPEVTRNENFRNRHLALHPTPETATIFSDIPQYDLDEGLQVTLNQVVVLLEDSIEPVIVSVAGGSASGKTSAVASKIAERHHDNAIVISMDDYYRGATYMNQQATQGNRLNWDQPEALDIGMLTDHLQALKRGKTIQKPQYDFSTGERVGYEPIEPKRLIILEGLFALHDDLKDASDLRTFIDIGMHGRVLRRLIRDVKRTGQRPDDILKYFADVVEPMHDKYIASTRQNADLVISNDFQPHVESMRTGEQELQIKYRIDQAVSSNHIRVTGAELLGSTRQRDIYYNPHDRDLAQTGESLRIRRESTLQDEDGILFTYKGPRQPSQFRRRAKLNFVIDEEIASAFTALYGRQIKRIDKARTVYEYDGLIFSHDLVAINEEGRQGHVVCLEFRLDDEEDTRHHHILEQLGINPESGETTPYAAM